MRQADLAPKKNVETTTSSQKKARDEVARPSAGAINGHGVGGRF